MASITRVSPTSPCNDTKANPAPAISQFSVSVEVLSQVPLLLVDYSSINKACIIAWSS